VHFHSFLKYLVQL